MREAWRGTTEAKVGEDDEQLDLEEEEPHRMKREVRLAACDTLSCIRHDGEGSR